MAIPELVTVRDLTTYRYADVTENLDTPIQDILSRAENAIQARLQRPLKIATFTERWRPTTNVGFVTKRPLRSITTFKRRVSHLHSWETVDPATVFISVEPGYFETYGFDIRGYEIEVTYTAGMFADGTALTGDVREAILLQAILFSYQDLEVFGTGDSRAPGIMYFAAQIQELLAAYPATKNVWH